MVSHPREKEMPEYQNEQREALAMVRQHLASLTEHELENLRERTADYLVFRQDVDAFLKKYFSDLCTQTCYHNQLSACCTKEGIITFFADGVVNALESSEEQLETLQERLAFPHQGNKCIYLGDRGCLWQMKPLVCEMFLCAKAEKEVLAENSRARKTWESLKQREKTFRWPDQAILFDDLEEIFIRAGYSSTLMYLHNSPGLIRIKAMRDG